MKKFLALVLALLMALSCFSFAGAEGEGSLPTTGTEVGGNQQTENQEQQLPNGNEQTTCAPDKHHVVTWLVDKEASCTEEGKEHGECTVCHKQVERVVEKKAHVHAEGAVPTEYKPATCTEDGFAVYAKCAHCDAKNIKEVFPALNHELARDSKNDVNATCTTDGSLAYKCTREGCTYTETKPVEKLGHFWYKTDWVYTNEELKSIKYVDAKPQYTAIDDTQINWHAGTSNDPYYGLPSCKEDGKDGMIAVCSLCGTYYNGEDPKFANGEVLPKLTHDVDFINSFVAGYNAEKNTCTAGTYTVDNNLVIGKIDVPAYTVDFKGTYGPLTYEYQPETCEKDGFVKLVCSCGWEKTITIPARGHNYRVMNIQYVDYANNVCTVKLGVLDSMEFGGDPKSQVSKIVNNVDDAAEHLLNIGKLTEEQYAFVIKVFKYFWQQNYVNQRLMKDCTEAPIVQLVCRNFLPNPPYSEEKDTRCEARRIDAAGWSCDEHDYTVTLGYRQKQADDLQEFEYDENGKRVDKTGREISLADCTDYVEILQCEHCFQTIEVSRKGKGHDLKDLTVLETETCSKTGLKAVKCSKCNYTEVKTILPHTPVAAEGKDKVIKNATCTEAGTMQHTCAKCSETYTTVIPAAGHNWVTKETKRATCDQAGEEDKYCTACGIHAEGYPKVIAQRHVFDRIASVKNISWRIDDNGYLRYEIIDCTKDAELQYYCKNCKLVKITQKAHTAHDLVAGEAATDIRNEKDVKGDDTTCLHTYEQKFYCNDCQHSEWVKMTDKYEHEWDRSAANSYIEPTATKGKCGEVGEAYYLCKYCHSYYKAASLPIEHDWKTTWDAEKNQWTYTCERCGVEKSAVLEAPKYNVDLSGVTFGVKTTGKGKIVLQNDTAATWILSTKYAYVRWTFKDGAGEDWVFDDVRVIDENGYFNANGIKAPAGATLHEFLVIITDDANADSKMLNQIKRYGHATK